MDRVVLSLRSIYMLLVSEDYPDYSGSVIARAERKGLTMLRFWQGMLSPEFREQPCGQMLWRSDGKRNRYTSYLCNRSGEIRNYSLYARELSARLSRNSLGAQIALFTDFLSARKYRHDILLRRVRMLTELARKEDPRVSEAMAADILRAADWEPPAREARVFQASYLLTVLTLYAAAGEAMDGPDMAALRSEEYGIGPLWDFLGLTGQKQAGISFLTVHCGILQDKPLPRHRFFGREEELFELKELAAAGRKCLIAGMGGLGKTELLRQLIRVCEEERIVEKIAVVPYEGNLLESFARSFPGFQRNNPEESFRSVLHRLEKEGAAGKLLLVIDNLTLSPETAPELEKLRSLPCGILISSRRGFIEGMETYPLAQPGIGVGSLIFRDNYGRPLSQEDRKCLEGMLTDEALCHPLTLRLMASTARSKGWSVEELKRQLQRGGGRTLELSRVYRQLYSYTRIPEESRALAELFTLLPRDSYSLEFLEEWFPQVTQENLMALTRGGWLDRDGTGFSMHPLIAQCLRRTVIRESHLTGHMERLIRRFCEMEWADAELYGDARSQRLSSILLYATDFLSGSVGSDLQCAFYRAGTLLMETLQEKERFLKRAKRMEKRCKEGSCRLEALRCTALARFGALDREQLLAFHDAQRDNRTIPERMYLDFCMAASNCFHAAKDYETAQALIHEVLAGNAAVSLKADAYLRLCACYDNSGNREEARRYGLEAAEYALAHDEFRADTKATLLIMACQMETVFGNGEGASQLLGALREAMEGQTNPFLMTEYEITAGTFEMYFGSLEQAGQHLGRGIALIEEYFGKAVAYYSGLGQYAIVLQRLGRYAEAEKIYLELLDYARETKDTPMLSVFGNNLAVTYLELGRPREALTHLETTLEVARNQGGIALGEAQRNRARAYGLLGDRQQEYRCLLEASPLLDAAYGPDHPRSSAARQRLAELKEELTE